MTWTAIANPSAGRGATARRLPALRRVLGDLGLDVVVEVSASLDDARDRAVAAVERGDDLVAVGGDGLVGALAGVAAGHDARLAIVPTGSGNDFAASLGLDPRRPGPALAAIGHGRDRLVDLGRVELDHAGVDPACGTWYAGITCSGFDAEANRWANEVRRLRGTPLYVAAVARTLATFRPRRFVVTVDGTVHDTEAWMVSVGNNARYAGGMRMTPHARLDDGLLDVCIVGPVSRLAFVRTFPSVFRGDHVAHPLVRSLRGQEVHVACPDEPAFEIWADGERIGPLPATVRAVAGALAVRVPAGAPPVGRPA